MNLEENSDEEFRIEYVRRAQPSSQKSILDIIWKNFMSEDFFEVRLSIF